MIELSSPARTLRLWNAQESTRTVGGNVTVAVVETQDSHEALLTGFEGQERVILAGVASANRLQAAGWGGSRLDALAEWTAALETFVDGAQGSGHTLSSDERSRTITGVVENVGWQRSSAAPYEVEWSIEMLRGNGLMPFDDTGPKAVSPGGRSTFDGWTLDEVRQLQHEKAQQFEVYARMKAPPGDNDVLPNTGAQRSFTLVGRIAGTTKRNDFDDHVRGLVGQDTTVTYAPAFPGYEVEVMVRDYESTRNAGLSRLGEFAIEMVEGSPDTNYSYGGGS